MKKITTISLSILVSTLLITITTIAAAERVKVHELAESRVIIMFPMTSEEISAENAEKARLNSTREENVTKPEERLHLFEMAESGLTISFPMSAVEIAARDAEKNINSAIKKIKPQKRGILIELAEGGHVIEFLAHEIEPVAESTNKIIGTTAKTEVGNSKN